jgi:hypothetical protein
MVGRNMRFEENHLATSVKNLKTCVFFGQEFQFFGCYAIERH